MSNLAHKLQEQEDILLHEEHSPKKRPRPKRFAITKGEKILIGMFILGTMMMSVKTVSMIAEIYTTNADIQTIQSEITKQQAINKDLSEQVRHLSGSSRILKIAEQQGLKINSQNIRGIAN